MPKWCETVVIVGKEEEIDIGVIVKILRYLASVKEAKVSEIVENAHIGYNTASKYIMYLSERGLVEVERFGKAKIVKITDKGMRFLLDVARVYSYLGIQL